MSLTDENSEKLDKINDSLDILFNSFKNGIPKKNIFTRSEYIDIYTYSYNICIIKSDTFTFPEIIYNNYQLKLKEYLKMAYDNVIKQENIVDSIVYEYEKFQLVNKWMTLIFKYLDRHYIRIKNLLPLEQNGNQMFYNNVFLPTFDSKNYSGLNYLLNKINNYRMLNDINEKKIIDTYLKLILYHDDSYQIFSKNFILNTTTFYSNLVKINNAIKDYIDKCENIIKFENDNIFLIKHETIDRLLLELYQVLIYNYSDDILSDHTHGILNLIRKDDYKNISQIYRLLLNNCNLLNVINTIFDKNINNSLSKIINELQSENKINYRKLIEDTIDVYDKHNYIISECFNDNSIYRFTLSQQLSQYFDITIKNEINYFYLILFINDLILDEKLDKELINHKINKSIILFKFINEKDMFIEKYQYYLSSRLLSSNSKDIDLEKYVVSQIRLECGYSFVSKLELMLTDYTMLSERNNNFNDYIKNNNIDISHNFSTSVITHGLWPTFRNDKLILPKEMEDSINIYSTYYNKINPSHKLTFIYQNNIVQLNRIFNDTRYIIDCNIYQALVLLLFNSNNGIQYHVILKNTGIDEDIIKKILHSLTCTKYKLLKKSNNDNVISSNETFYINDDFKHDIKRIKLSCPSLDIKNNVKENKVNIDRVQLIDSVIVRLLKSRKTLEHNILISEIHSHIKHFSPDIVMIKHRIESLIEREYIEREYIERTDINCYNYVA